MASNKPGSEDMIRQAKESLRSPDTSRMPPADVPVEDAAPPVDHRTVTERMIDEGQIDQPPSPAPAPVARLTPNPSAPRPKPPRPKPPRPAEKSSSVLPPTPVRKPRKGRVRRFFGWITLIVIALSWIRMLSGLGDELDVVVSIGAALFITAIPAFLALLLIGAGTSQVPDSEPSPEPESGSRSGRFLRFIGWIILGLTALAWIALILSLIDDPSGIVGIILGGLVVSVIPIIAALILLGDGDAITVEDQNTPDAT